MLLTCEKGTEIIIELRPSSINTELISSTIECAAHVIKFISRMHDIITQILEDKFIVSSIRYMTQKPVDAFCVLACIVYPKDTKTMKFLDDIMDVPINPSIISTCKL